MIDGGDRARGNAPRVVECVVDLPSRGGHFTNLGSGAGARGVPEQSSATWGNASQQTDFETYIATHKRANLPEDQTIRTEKVNILLKHFYGLGQEHQEHQQGGASGGGHKGGVKDGKGKGKRSLVALSRDRSLKKRK